MKKNMRKVAALGLCVALGATMLTACGGSKGESASGGKTELNFGIWDENQRPAMEKMVKAYEKENSDVKINIQLTPYKGGGNTGQNLKLQQVEEKLRMYSG